MNNLYKAEFDYTGEIPEGTTKEIIETMLIAVHNAFAKNSEVLYSIWNAQWDMMNAGDERPENKEDEYTKFIIKNMNEFFKGSKTKAVEEQFKKFGIKEAFAGDEADVRLRLENGTEVQFWMKEVAA